MDLCSVEFYVERAKISGTCNHGAFWNKLNIYPGARWKKTHNNHKKKMKKDSRGLSLVCTVEKYHWEYKIKQHCQIFECLLIYLGLFLILKKKRFFIILLFFPLSGVFPSLPQEIPDRSLSFLAWSSSPLSHLPTGHKSLLFEDKWM